MTKFGFDKRFKICLVSISLAKGGAERSCAILSHMLHDEGHNLHVVVLNNDIDFSYKGVLFNLGLLKKGKDNFWKRLYRFKQFRDYLKNNSFDVIIDHRPKNNYYRELFYDRYVYKDLKRIYVAHTSKENQVLTNQPLKFVEILNKNSSNVSVSNYIKNNILQKAGVNKCTTIHNTVNDNWGGQKVECPPVLNNKTYLLSYGRIDDKVKDFVFLIESFTHSEVWKDNKYLVIMGDGKDKKKIQKFAESLPSSNQILFLPFTKNPFPFIVHAKFVVLTSRYEGFPMVLVESLYAGTPVVSLDIISGPSEIIIDKVNGLLILKREVSLFSKGIKTMFNNFVLYNKCKENTKVSITKFYMKVVSKKWNQLLQDELY